MEQYGMKLPGMSLLPELSVYTRTTPPGILLWVPCGLLLPLLVPAPQLANRKVRNSLIIQYFPQEAEQKLLASWYKFFENLIVSQQVNNLPAFMDPEVLPCLQKPTNGKLNQVHILTSYFSHINFEGKKFWRLAVSETLVFDQTLTWLIALEDFITFMRRESFKSYIIFLYHQFEYYLLGTESSSNDAIKLPRR
jgi:hypothetical protein